MTIQTADVRQHLHALIQEIFPNGSSSHAWAPAWNLVLGLMRRYSSTGITIAILRAEAHSIIDAIQTARWQPLTFVSASSHDCRCRVRVHNVQPLLPASSTLVATLSDLDEICTRAAFIHRRHSHWALKWKGTTLRMGGIRLAANRILPTEQVVEEVAAKALTALLRSGGRVAGRVLRRRDLHCGGTCVTLKALDADGEIQWMALGKDASVSLLVFSGELVVLENFDRDTADCGSDAITSRPDTIVRVVDDADPEALPQKLDDPIVASQFDDALSQVNLTPACSQRSDPGLFDARDFDGQRPTIRAVLEVNGPVVNVSLTAIIRDIDRERKLCYISDASLAILAIRLDFVQSQTWEQGQTLFGYRLQSSRVADVLSAKSGAQIYNLSYALGLLASPNLYRRIALRERPRTMYSMFICRISIQTIDFPDSLSHRWHERVQAVAYDGDTEAHCGFSLVALESLLACPLAVFAGLDHDSKSSLLAGALHHDMLAMVTTTRQDFLRLEMLRPISGVSRPSLHR